jgi:hypothetical protein
VPCTACHFREGSGDDGEGFIRYRPLDSECADCHRGIDTDLSTIEAPARRNRAEQSSTDGSIDNR